MLSRAYSGKTSTLILATVLCAGLLAAVCLALTSHPRQAVGPGLLILQARAATISHQTQFVTLTNGAPMERGMRFAEWQVAKYRGVRFPVLSREITVGGLANLYRSLDALSAGILVPREFFELKASFPTNCVLTNAQTRLPVFRRALEEALCHSGVVGIREGPLLRLVKSEWVRTNSASDPPSISIVQPYGSANGSQPVHTETNQPSAAAGPGR